MLDNGLSRTTPHPSSPPGVRLAAAPMPMPIFKEREIERDSAGDVLLNLLTISASPIEPSAIQIFDPHLTQLALPSCGALSLLPSFVGCRPGLSRRDPFPEPNLFIVRQDEAQLSKWPKPHKW
mmetsp:Transcript_9320/g.25895  ORF Transcript_9320/g.25895 Transcript_9320/m.25895 type:complete len:123 (-) Transcript_9320:150-518(-)